MVPVSFQQLHPCPVFPLAGSLACPVRLCPAFPLLSWRTPRQPAHCLLWILRRHLKPPKCIYAAEVPDRTPSSFHRALSYPTRLTCTGLFHRALSYLPHGSHAQGSSTGLFHISLTAHMHRALPQGSFISPTRLTCTANVFPSTS